MDARISFGARCAIAYLALSWTAVPAHAAAESDEWKGQAARVAITRDDWGIAHVTGKTDADAVFGMIYAQAEDDFNRIETNYLTSLGRLAEAEGGSALWQDLRQRLFIDPEVLQADYARSPTRLQTLMQAWARGLNAYLATHPEVHPRVLAHFEPWMALSFSEGSIGGDIERVSLPELQAFYDHPAAAVTAGSSRTALSARDGEPAALDLEPRGSNGFAIAPSHTKNGHALLLINPHTTFYFRSELQVTSGEGLDAYGAVTWGQFFVYQGFNAKAGWMHTSSGVDNVDEFAETIVTGADGSLSYRYGQELRPLQRHSITLTYRTADGPPAKRTFPVYATHHGAIVRRDGERWIAAALMNKPVEALEQSFLRTKATDYESFLKVAQLKANSSNNTLFADSKGEIAYLHPQFVPMRDDRFDYRRPVDGSEPATDWRGLHSLGSLPHVVDPPNGWVMNTNNWPWTAAGADSPRAADFPRYMDEVGENPRGQHAEIVLNARKDFTPQTLIAAAYDSYLTAFARLIPLLIGAYDRLADGDPRRTALAGPVSMLRGWDFRSAIDSRPTSLAVFWGDALWAVSVQPGRDAQIPPWDTMAERTSDEQKLAALTAATDRLVKDFGSYAVAWGEINRLQRNDDAILQTFSDEKASLPVPFTWSRWGSLASFAAQPYPGTKRYYGTAGNSFVAVVEFGPTVHAWGVSVGGESGHPASPHFLDQAQRYVDGNLRPIYYYPADLRGHIERKYHPGSTEASAAAVLN
jgi:acyl-homoserine-lactone acylase